MLLQELVRSTVEKYVETNIDFITFPALLCLTRDRERTKFTNLIG